MKIPLKYGLPLLAILWIGSSAADDPRIEMLLRVAAIGVALWTAFSLPIPKSRPPAMEEMPAAMPEPDFTNGANPGGGKRAEPAGDSEHPAGDGGDGGDGGNGIDGNEIDGNEIDGNGIDRGNDPVATLLPGDRKK